MPNFTIPFTTPGNYTYNGSYIDVAGGLAFLKEDLIDTYLRWHMNESSGINVPDDSGNGRNGTTVNMEDGDWGPGKLNNCLTLDGSNESITGGDVANFTRTTPFAVEFWFKTTSSGVQTQIIGRQEASANLSGWGISHLNGFLFMTLRNNSTNRINVRTAVAGLNDGFWHHIVMNYDGTSLAAGIEWRIDNALVGNTVLNDALTLPITNGASFIIGTGGGLGYFPGSIDEVAVYTRELTVSEISYRWNAGAGSEVFPYWYDNDPTIYKTGGDNDPLISAFENFVVTTGPGHTGILVYQLSDNGTTWKYWDGDSWEVAGAADYNSEAVINTNISSFSVSTTYIYVKAFLISDATQLVSIDLIQVGYTTNLLPVVYAGTNKTTKDNTSIAPFSDCDFYDPDGTVDHVYYKVDGEVDVWTEILQGGYGTLLEAAQAFEYLFTNTGVKTVRLQAEDNEGEKSEDSLTVTVQKYTVTFNVRDKDTESHVSDLFFIPGDGSPGESKSSPFTWNYDYSVTGVCVDITKEGYIGVYCYTVPTTDHTENIVIYNATLYDAKAGIFWDSTTNKLITNVWFLTQGRIALSVTNVQIDVQIFNENGSITTLDTKSTTTFNSVGVAEIEFSSAELGGDLVDTELYALTCVFTYSGVDYTHVFSFHVGSDASKIRQQTIQDAIDYITKVFVNRWKIETNQMTVYDDDGATPLIVHDLKDRDGNPTETHITEKVPVP
jgi:hypothetical protein